MRGIQRVIGLIILLVLAASGQQFPATDKFGQLPAREDVSHVSNVLSTTCPLSKTVNDEPPKDENADRFGKGEWYVNSARTIWVRSTPWHSGEEGNKVVWIRPAGTQLIVTDGVSTRKDHRFASADRGYQRDSL
jgi:hypothetical protein